MASSSAAVVVVGGPTDNDESVSNRVNDTTGLKVDDDDSFTVVNSLGSSYLERFQHLRDDDSLSSTSSSASNHEEDDDSSDSSSSSSSSSNNDIDGSEEEEDTDNHFPIKTPQKITSSDTSTCSFQMEGREVTPSPKPKSSSLQQNYNRARKYTSQHTDDVQLLTTIIQSRATRPTEMVSYQTSSSHSNNNNNPRERFDNLCHEYITDGEENIWNLPLWKLAGVVLDRLNDGGTDGVGRGEEEEEVESSSSSLGSSTSSSDSSSSSSSDSSSSSSSDEEENEVDDEDSIGKRDQENDVNMVDSNNKIHGTQIVSQESQLPSQSSPLDVDVGKQKMTSAVDNTADTATTLMGEEKGKEEDVEPPNKKCKLSQEEVQTTFQSALDSNASFSSSAEEDEIDQNDDDDNNSFTRVDFHESSQDNQSLNIDSSMASPPSSPLGRSDSDVDTQEIKSEAAAAGAVKSIEESSDEEVFTPSNNKKRKVPQKDEQPTFAAAFNSTASTISSVEKDVRRSGDDDSFTEVDFHGSQDNQSVNEDSSMASPSSLLGGGAGRSKTADDGTRKIPSAVDILDDVATSKITASASLMGAGSKKVAHSKGKRTFAQVESQPVATASEVVVVVSAAAKEGELSYSSSAKEMAPSSFINRAKRKLFHEGDQPPPAKERSKDAAHDWISHFAAKAVLAAQKEKKIGQEKGSYNEQTTKAVEPRGESTKKMTSKKRARKICSIESCTSQARGGGLCQRHGSKASLCNVEGCTNQVINGGVCIRHGAKVTLKKKGPRLRCSVETCTNFARIGGVCIRHGATEQRRRCGREGCCKQALKGGFCVSHGAQMFCSEVIGGASQEGELCTSPDKNVSTRKREYKKCSREDCDKLAQKGGLCYSHGAAAAKCSYEGCTNNAKRRGLCKRHGAYHET